jgi:hypothetical protein
MKFSFFNLYCKEVEWKISEYFCLPAAVSGLFFMFDIQTESFEVKMADGWWPFL